MKQSYQELSRVIARDLVGLSKLGVKNTNKINIKEFQGDHQGYFFYRKNKFPDKYGRLAFDTNGHTPYSKDLGEIMMDFIICGFLDYEKNIRLEEITNFINSEKRKISP
jgi:hypothetical protein